MRQLIFRVPRGEGERVVAVAEERGAMNLTVLEAKQGGHLLTIHAHETRSGILYAQRCSSVPGDEEGLETQLEGEVKRPQAESDFTPLASVERPELPG